MQDRARVLHIAFFLGFIIGTVGTIGYLSQNVYFYRDFPANLPSSQDLVYRVVSGTSLGASLVGQVVLYLAAGLMLWKEREYALAQTEGRVIAITILIAGVVMRLTHFSISQSWSLLYRTMTPSIYYNLQTVLSILGHFLVALGIGLLVLGTLTPQARGQGEPFPPAPVFEEEPVAEGGNSHELQSAKVSQHS